MLELQRQVGNQAVGALMRLLDPVPVTIDRSMSEKGFAAAADGEGIRVDPRWLGPRGTGGLRLVAHELAHLAHQRGAQGIVGPGERAADDLADRAVRGRSVTIPPQVLPPRPAAVRHKTAVDAAKDAIRDATEGIGTDEDAIFDALRNLTPAQLAELSTDRDILARLRDDLSDDELATAGALLARGRVGTMSRADVAAVAADPVGQSLGTLAAAEARGQLLEHRERQATTGVGTIQGNRCPNPLPVGAREADCTTYVLDVLEQAFTAKGQAAAWTKVMATARKGGGRLKGTEVLQALQAEAGWEGRFWAPDPRNPQDHKAEHPTAYRKVRESGTYYGVTVDPARSVVDYRRTDPASTTDLSGIETLRRLPFGVLAARGGTHMALIVNGSVYEVHWDEPASDPDAIEATPLESYAWQSGVVVAPKGDLGRADLTP